MKKILSLILSVLIILTMLTPVAFASGEIVIVSPGASCTTDLNKIQVECDNASKIIFELDGEKIGETTGEKELALSDGTLTVGNHTLRVSAIYPDKTASQIEHDFTAYDLISLNSSKQDFNSYVAGRESDVGISFASQGGIAAVMPDVGVSSSAGDLSLKMYMTINDHKTSGCPFLTYTKFKNYGEKGIVTFKFDIKTNEPTQALVNLASMPLTGGILAFFNKGKILDTDVAIPSGWMNVNIVENYNEGTVTIHLNDSVVYDGPSNGHSVAISDKVELTLKQNGARASADKRSALWLDNFDFKQELVYALDKISYSDDGLWNEYTNSLPASADAIKLHLSSNMDASTINKNTVSVYENGAKVEIDDPIYNDSEKTVTITPSQSFNKGSNVVVELNTNVKLAGSIAVLPSLEARVSTEAPYLTPISVDFKKGSSALVSAAQLQSGDSVSADVVLNNDTDELKNMSVILLVRQNKKLRAIAAVETTLSPHTTSPVTVLIPAVSSIDAQGDVSVKLAICDTVASSKPYMAYTEIK